MPTRPKTPSFKRPRKKGFSKTKNLFGSQPKEGEYEFAPLPDLPGADMRSDKEKQVARTLGDDKLAKDVLRLQENEYPNGTLPELVTENYLRKWNVPHWYQVALFGGHVRGGLIPDFVISQGGTGQALQIQGTYWHEGFEAEEIDRTAKVRMLGHVVNGVRIEQVVEVWDTTLYSDPEHVLRLALAGIELGR